jgi:hypothetical protein
MASYGERKMAKAEVVFVAYVEEGRAAAPR